MGGDGGLQTFIKFMGFVVRVSKEERRLHVVFTSSDSYFLEWLQEGLPISVDS